MDAYGRRQEGGKGLGSIGSILTEWEGYEVVVEVAVMVSNVFFGCINASGSREEV